MNKPRKSPAPLTPLETAGIVAAIVFVILTAVAATMPCEPGATHIAAVCE